MIDDRSNDPKPTPLGERWDEDERSDFGIVMLTFPHKPLREFIERIDSGDLTVPETWGVEDLVGVADAEGYFTPEATEDEKIELLLSLLDQQEETQAFAVAHEALTEEGFSAEEVHEVFYSEDQPRDDSGRWTSGGGGPAPLNLTKEEQKAKWKEYGKRYRENKAKKIAEAKAKGEVWQPQKKGEKPAAAPAATPPASPASAPGPHADPTSPTQYTNATGYDGPPKLNGTAQEVEDMTKILATLPPEHMDGMRSFSYVDIVGGNPNTMGRWKWDQQIEIRRGYAAGASLRHEVGHNLHIAKLTEAAAEEFRVLSNGGKNCTVSNYGRTNTGEHFAEAYRVMGHPIKENNLKVKEPKTWAYMNRLLRTPEGKSMLLPKGVRISEKSGVGRYYGKPWKG